MSESNESYYEIALTHREVLVAFVAILACVLGAFLGGVWLGRRGADELLAQERLAGDSGAAAEKAGDGQDLAELEEFRFFSDEDNGAAGDDGLSKPDLSKLLDEPSPDTTLAQDVGSAPRPRGPKTDAERQAAQERRRRRQERLDTSQPPEGHAPRGAPRQKPSRQEREHTAKPPAERPASPPPPPPPAPAPTTTVAAPPPPAAPAAPQEGFVIQVFSTHDQPQARKVLNQLQGSGFLAFMSPVEVDGATMYRVRIGPFGDKPEAEASAAQVRQKFKLDTWVTAASN